MSTWYDDMTMDQIDKLGKEIDGRETDDVFQVCRNGTVDGPAGIYGPESVEHDDEHDILIDGVPLKAATGKGWQALTGYTGQDRYSGAVMHVSEFIGGGLAEGIIEMSAEAEAEGEPLLWTICVVNVEPDDDDPEPEPAGWAVLYRRI
jgi:hypothetical protein